MDIQKLMRKAGDIKKKMDQMQKVIEEKEITGTSGGGAVKIHTTGKGEVKKISLEKDIVNPEEIEILEDLIVAAFNNAKQAADEFSKEEMEKLGIPSSGFPGF